jgi:hypothetical protein
MVTIAEAAFNQLTGVVGLLECLLRSVELTPQSKYHDGLVKIFQLLWSYEDHSRSSLFLTTWTVDGVLIVGIPADAAGRFELASDFMAILKWLSAVLEPLEPPENDNESFTLRHPFRDLLPLGDPRRLREGISYVAVAENLGLTVQMPSLLNTAEINTKKNGCWRKKIRGGVLLQASKPLLPADIPIKLDANEQNSLILTAGALWSLFYHRLEPIDGCGCTFRIGEQEFLTCRKRERVPESPDWYFWHYFTEPAELCNGENCKKTVSMDFTDPDRIHFKSPCVLGWAAHTRVSPRDPIARKIEISASFAKRKEITYSASSFHLQAQLGYSGVLQAQSVAGITFDMKRYNVANSIPYNSILATALTEVATVLVYCEERGIHLAMHGADLVEAICMNLLDQLLVSEESMPSFSQPCAIERMRTWRESTFITSSGLLVPGAVLVTYACRRVQEFLSQTRSLKKPLYWSFRDMLAGTVCTGLKAPNEVKRTGWYALSMDFPLLIVAVGQIEDKLLFPLNNPNISSLQWPSTPRLPILTHVSVLPKQPCRGGVLSDNNFIKALHRQALSIYPIILEQGETMLMEIEGMFFLIKKADRDGVHAIESPKCVLCGSTSDSIWPRAICLHYFY